jgi:cell division protein FtsB
MRIGRYLLLIILFVGFFIVFGNRGFLDNQRLKEKLSDLRAENSRFETINNSLKREAVLLREDLRYIEVVARNELGMVKKGDLLYRHMESPAKVEEAVPPPASGMDRPTPDDAPSDKSLQNAERHPSVQPGSSI